MKAINIDNTQQEWLLDMLVVALRFSLREYGPGTQKGYASTLEHVAKEMQLDTKRQEYIRKVLGIAAERQA